MLRGAPVSCLPRCSGETQLFYSQGCLFHDDIRVIPAFFFRQLLEHAPEEQARLDFGRTGGRRLECIATRVGLEGRQPVVLDDGHGPPVGCGWDFARPLIAEDFGIRLARLPGIVARPFGEQRAFTAGQRLAVRVNGSDDQDQVAQRDIRGDVVSGLVVGDCYVYHHLPTLQRGGCGHGDGVLQEFLIRCAGHGVIVKSPAAIQPALFREDEVRHLRHRHVTILA